MNFENNRYTDIESIDENEKIEFAFIASLYFRN